MITTHAHIGRVLTARFSPRDPSQPAPEPPERDAHYGPPVRLGADLSPRVSARAVLEAYEAEASLRSRHRGLHTIRTAAATAERAAADLRDLGVPPREWVRHYFDRHSGALLPTLYDVYRYPAMPRDARKFRDAGGRVDARVADRLRRAIYWRAWADRLALEISPAVVARSPWVPERARAAWAAWAHAPNPRTPR